MSEPTSTRNLRSSGKRTVSNSDAAQVISVSSAVRKKNDILKILEDKEMDLKTKYVCILPDCLKIFNRTDSLSRHLRSDHFTDRCPANINGIACDFIVKDSRKLKKHYQDKHPEEVQPKRSNFVARTKFRHICMDCFRWYYNSKKIPFLKEHFAVLGKIPITTHDKNGALNACCRARPNIYVKKRRQMTKKNKTRNVPSTQKPTSKENSTAPPNMTTETVNEEDITEKESTTNNTREESVEGSNEDIEGDHNDVVIRQDMKDCDEESMEGGRGEKVRMEQVGVEKEVLEDEGGAAGGMTVGLGIKNKEAIIGERENLGGIGMESGNECESGKSMEVINGVEEEKQAEDDTSDQNHVILEDDYDRGECSHDLESPKSPLKTTDENVPDWKSMYEEEALKTQEIEEEVAHLNNKIRTLQIQCEEEKSARIAAEVKANVWENEIGKKLELFKNKDYIRQVAVQLQEKNAKIRILQEQNNSIGKQIHEFKERIPQFTKLPPLASKIKDLPLDYTTAMENLQQIKDNPLPSLIFTVLSLQSDVTAYSDNLNRLRNGLDTYEEEIHKYEMEYKTLNRKSNNHPVDTHLPAHQRQEPDIVVGPEAVKSLNNAIPFTPKFNKPDLSQDIPRGPIAVVDGTNVVCGHDSTGKITEMKSRCQTSQRPDPYFRVLYNWIVEMIKNSVFRSIIVVLREDVIFDVESGELKLMNDPAFLQFMIMVAEPDVPVRMIIVPSPCYDDIIVVMVANELNGVIISNDKYRDLWDSKWVNKNASKKNVVRGLCHKLGDFLTDQENGVLIPFTYVYTSESAHEVYPSMLKLNPDPSGPRGKNLHQKLFKLS